MSKSVGLVCLVVYVLILFGLRYFHLVGNAETVLLTVGVMLLLLFAGRKGQKKR